MLLDRSIHDGKHHSARAVLGLCAALLILNGCSAAAHGDAGEASTPSDLSQPPSVDASPTDVLTADDLYTVYQAVLADAVVSTDPSTLVAGALKGAHRAAAEEGLLPIEDAILDTSEAKQSKDPRAVWSGFGDAYDAFVQKLGSRVSVAAVGKGAAKGMLAAVGDPLTTYLDKSAVDAMQSPSDAGIGVVLTPAADSGPPIVREVEPDGPAARAGIQIGDTIVAVDSKPSRDRDIYDVLSALSGPEKSQVTVTIRSAGETETRDVDVQRAAVHPPPVSTKLVGSVEVVQIHAFNPGTGDAVRHALADSISAGATGWLLDLRGDGEGTLTEAVNVASLFAGDQVLAIQEEHGGGQTPIRGTGLALSTQEPLVILVDGATAGPGELVAAAIHDHGLGTVVGTPTAGRLGTPQLVPLSDGSAAEITTRRLLGPSGGSLLGTGVAPDQVVADDAAGLAAGVDQVRDQGMALLP